MARTLKPDKFLFWATLLLVCASLVMVYSASAVLAQMRYQRPPHFFLFRQLVWGAIGFGLLVAAMRVDYHHYRRPAVIWSFLAVVVTGLLAVFLFEPINGAQRWILIGGVSIQPSEAAKLAAIVFAAALLERRMHRINDAAYALLPIGIVTGGLAALIVFEDFGTAFMLVAIVATIVFAAGLSYRYLAGAGIVLLPVMMLLVASEPYRVRRVMAFLDPWQDPLDAGYQTIQSLIAVGSGGAFGQGLMGGMQKLFYIPEPHTDYIFAVIAEELGLVGTTVVVLCFAIIAWRGLRTALVAPDRFGALLALGVTAMVTLQALFNMSVVVGLLPTKGIPLPFVSNGGSSLVVNLVAMGILLNISQQASATAALALAPGAALGGAAAGGFALEQGQDA